MLKPLPAHYDRTELRQLRLIFEDLKELHRTEVEAGDLEAAHELLVTRLRLMKEVLLEQEWRVGPLETGHDRLSLDASGFVPLHDRRAAR